MKDISEDIRDFNVSECSSYRRSGFEVDAIRMESSIGSLRESIIIGRDIEFNDSKADFLSSYLMKQENEKDKFYISSNLRTSFYSADKMAIGLKDDKLNIKDIKNTDIKSYLVGVSSSSDKKEHYFKVSRFLTYVSDVLQYYESIENKEFISILKYSRKVFYLKAIMMEEAGTKGNYEGLDLESYIKQVSADSENHNIFESQSLDFECILRLFKSKKYDDIYREIKKILGKCVIWMLQISENNNIEHRLIIKYYIALVYISTQDDFYLKYEKDVPFDWAEFVDYLQKASYIGSMHSKAKEYYFDDGMD